MNIQKMPRILPVVGVAVLAGPHKRALGGITILTGCILAFGIAVGHIITGGIGDQILAISSLGTFLTAGL